MLVGCLQYLNSAGSVSCHTTGEEMATGTEAEFGGTERVFYRAVRAGLRDEATLLSLGQAVDTVVQENHVQVDVTTVGVNEVVATDSQSVTITTDLPYG